jgi:hypothetical protein
MKSCMSLPDSTADVTPGAGMMCQAPAGAAEVLGCHGMSWDIMVNTLIIIYTHDIISYNYNTHIYV